MGYMRLPSAFLKCTLRLNSWAGILTLYPAIRAVSMSIASDEVNRSTLSTASIAGPSYTVTGILTNSLLPLSRYFLVFLSLISSGVAYLRINLCSRWYSSLTTPVPILTFCISGENIFLRNFRICFCHQSRASSIFRASSWVTTSGSSVLTIQTFFCEKIASIRRYNTASTKVLVSGIATFEQSG